MQTARPVRKGRAVRGGHTVRTPVRQHTWRARGKLPDSATLRDLVLVVRAAGAAVIEKPLLGDEVSSAISRLLEARKAA